MKPRTDLTVMILIFLPNLISFAQHRREIVKLDGGLKVYVSTNFHPIKIEEDCIDTLGFRITAMEALQDSLGTKLVMLSTDFSFNDNSNKVWDYVFKVVAKDGIWSQLSEWCVQKTAGDLHGPIQKFFL